MDSMHEQTSQQTNNPITLQDFLAELGRDDVARINLAGYFVVLIEMDLELKESERNLQDGNNNHNREAD